MVQQQIPNGTTYKRNAVRGSGAEQQGPEARGNTREIQNFSYYILH